MLWRISRMCCFECSGTQRGTSRTSCRIGGSHFLPGDPDQSRALGKDCQDVQLGTVTLASSPWGAEAFRAPVDTDLRADCASPEAEDLFRKIALGFRKEES